MTNPPRRLLIVDQSLRDFDGHHYEYDLAVARAAHQLGIQPSVLAHRSFVAVDAFEARVVPWFTESWTETGRGRLRPLVYGLIALMPTRIRKVLIALAAAGRRVIPDSFGFGKGTQALPPFGAEFRAALDVEKLGSEDHVLVHTASNAELHSLLQSCTNFSLQPHVHIVLRRDAEEANVSDDPWGGIAAVFDTIRSSAALKGRVHLHADTEPLTIQYRALTGGLPVSTIPIPHCLPDKPSSPREPGPLRVVYLGNARSEKGFELLPDLVAAVKDSLLMGAKARFILQSNHSMSLEEGVISEARRRLQAYPPAMVELLDQPLDPANFQLLLERADIVLLPYRAKFYRRRSSGILVQAAIWAKPMIVPAHSWLADEAPVGTAEVFSSPTDLEDAMIRAVTNFDRLKVAAQSTAPVMRNRHNGGRLVSALVDAANVSN